MTTSYDHLLCLKFFFFDSVGTVAAAATTSLPEEIGGVRNWDYRFTWIRDSSFIFEALFRLGHVTEAEEYIRWLIHECYLSLVPVDPSNLQIMYGLKGDQKIDEEILSHLDGYRGSKPVRIGNNAYKQKQWDIYGSILNVVWKLHAIETHKPVPEGTWKVLRILADYVVKIWREPDEGLWEVKSGKEHFVYSKVMCWVALDRAVKLMEAHNLDGNKEQWERERDAIYEEVFARGWNEELQSFTQSFDSYNLDAALLLLPAVGFIDGHHPKMISTIHALRKKLDRGGGLIARYTSRDGLPGNEGAFLLASFWLVDALVYAGEVQEARELFEKLLAKANHTGLFSEEINPQNDEFLGNFPQAYTHIGLINSAFTLGDALSKAKEEKSI